MALHGLLVVTVLLGVSVGQLVVIVDIDMSNVNVLHEKGDPGKHVIGFLLCDVGQGVGEPWVAELATGILASRVCLASCVRECIMRSAARIHNALQRQDV